MVSMLRSRFQRQSQRGALLELGLEDHSVEFVENRV
jgi:hypothetical protein